jgi:hypothetical protein
MRRWVDPKPTTLDRVRRNLQRLGSPVHSETPEGDRDGTNATFRLVGRARDTSIRVYVNGVRKHPDEYTIDFDTTTGRTRIVLATPPSSCDRVMVDYDQY